MTITVVVFIFLCCSWILPIFRTPFVCSVLSVSVSASRCVSSIGLSVSYLGSGLDPAVIPSTFVNRSAKLVKSSDGFSWRESSLSISSVTIVTTVTIVIVVVVIVIISIVAIVIRSIVVIVIQIIAGFLNGSSISRTVVVFPNGISERRTLAIPVFDAGI